jgi:chemotaxis protein MotB
MGRVGKALVEMKDKQVWVQGHTDNVPVREDNEKFSSNWELSAARALTVVHYLQEESGVNPRRLAAAAFGSHRPVSRKKKAKNRRIEIVLFPLEVKLRR